MKKILILLLTVLILIPFADAKTPRSKHFARISKERRKEIKRHRNEGHDIARKRVKRFKQQQLNILAQKDYRPHKAGQTRTEPIAPPTMVGRSEKCEKSIQNRANDAKRMRERHEKHHGHK